MQVVIFAGGYGSRLAEETDRLPKPMVKIGGIPILVHIMRWYKKYGHGQFLISSGYKHEVIEEYFSRHCNEFRLGKDLDIVNTGLDTNTAGRLFGLHKLLDDNFLLTYGDGLSNVNLDELVRQYYFRNQIGIVTAVRPPARFGTLDITDGQVTGFREKSLSDVGWINGGFFVFSKEVLSYIESKCETFEGGALARLATAGQLGAYKHSNWWHPMDTLRDKRLLEELWEHGDAPWKC